MKVLIACEFSGRVRDAFLAKGHEAWSCDIIDSDTPWPCNHIKKDIIEVIYDWKWQWDLMIAFPPCTYLALSGIHWNNRIPSRAEKTAEALKFIRSLLDAPIDRIALENPVGVISTMVTPTAAAVLSTICDKFGQMPDMTIETVGYGAGKRDNDEMPNLLRVNIRKPDQYIQPWQFGEPYSKKTGLWLKNLPKLEPTNILTPTVFQKDGKTPRWKNQTPAGQNNLGPSKDRAKLRSITYQGIADAMAEQWG